MKKNQRIAALLWGLSAALACTNASAVDVSNAPIPAAEARLIPGTDAVVALPKPVPILQGAATSFRFEEAPIAEFATIVLKDVVKVDYVLHQPLNGSVTLSTNGDVSPDQAVLLLESALQANGLVMARDTRGTYHVGKPEALRGIVPALRQAVPGSALPPGSGAIVVRLQYIGATEMAAILRPMLAPDSLVRVDNLRNLLVLAGTRTQAEGWLDVVSTFDVDLLKGMSVGVFPLKYATLKEVDAALRLMSGGASAAAAAAGTPSNAPGQASATATPAATPTVVSESPFLGAVRIMPIERLNSVLVVTPRAAYLEEARAWIERLDQPNANSTEPQLFIYPVQNGSARHLAGVISGLFGAGGTAAVNSNTGVAPSLGAATATTANVAGASMFGSTTTAARTGVSASTTTSAQGGALNRTNTGGTAGVTAVALTPSVRMIADEINNAVLFYGARADFVKIESALKRLDISPIQVLIEASIIEVTLTDDLEYGLQWLFSGGAPGSLSGKGAISSAAGGVLGGAKSGFSYTLTNSAGNIRAVLNALAGKSLVKVISSPSVMVLDNHTASITVGNQQPIKSATSVTTAGLPVETIQYKDAGVSLTVTPSVTAGNMVTMDMNQTVTDVGNIDAATGQRAFLQRQINSKVAVRSGESLVLGGLIRDNNTSGSSGLPLLSSLPVVGGLFGTQSSNSARTELLVVLMPRVLRADQDLREISNELRDRMKGLGQPAQQPTATSIPIN